MSTKYFMISALLASLLVGCGSDDGDTADALTDTGYDITVERGPVYGALVLDSTGQRAESLGGAKYRFYEQPTYPITASGGYLDIDRNGQIDAGETVLQYTLQSEQGDVITLATTLACDPQLRTLLLSEYNLTEAMIDGGLPSTNETIASISDEVYAYCVENGMEPLELSSTELEKLQLQVQDRLHKYQSGSLSISQMEQALIQRLGLPTLQEYELSDVNETISCAAYPTHQNLLQLDTIPVSTLTDAQKDGLIFMIEEEKMARDVYEHLYTSWGIRIFDNISKSEQNHMDAIGSLVEKYSLDAPATLETRGSFENSELQSLYDELIAKGELSLIDALEVGVTIEETDIADLQAILDDGVPDDLQMVYENLLNGSYNHLNAFSNVLSAYQ